MHIEKGSVPYSFNESYTKRVSKGDFIKAHKHLEDLVDLPAEWDKFNPKGDESKPAADAESPKPGAVK